MKEMFQDDFELPNENQQIVKVVSSRGNNLHEVENSEENSEKFLVTMPTKFRKNMWVKRGDFVLIESIDEGDKVKGEIVRILTPDHVRIFTKDGIWPKKFTKKRDLEVDCSDDDELFKNTNRQGGNNDYQSSSDSSDIDEK